MSVNFIPYNAAFKDKALEIFASNCPKYFDPDDHSLFADFLDHFADEHYKMVVYDGVVVGCGGYYVKHETKNFGIAWVMIKRYALGARLFREISKQFFEAIINQIRSENLPYDVLINTTQLLEGYFHTFGFETEQIEMNGFGPGLHHITMRNRMFRKF
jgi:predicted GNAT family N-acyltransferase